MKISEWGAEGSIIRDLDGEFKKMAGEWITTHDFWSSQPNFEEKSSGS